MADPPDRDSNPFRAHWDLDPEVRFLNHGSFGASPRPVLEAQARLRVELEREPVRFMARELPDRLDAAREALARFVGAAPEDLAFVPNATTGVNAVVRSLDLSPGDEVLITDHAYNACRNAVQYVCDRSGARLAVAQVPFPLSSPAEAVDAILMWISPHTRLVMLDHITSPTGLVLPVAEIVEEMRERGVETLVDGAHGPGMVPLNLDELGAGYYTGNCHKWLCTPKGSGLLHVRRDLQDSVRPAVISHGANTPRPGRSRFQDEFDWTGTDDPTAFLTIPTAIEFLGGLLPGGWDELRERNRSLALEAQGVLAEALSIDRPAPQEMVGSLASLPLPAGDGDVTAEATGVDPVQSRLFEEHGIEVPIMSWPAAPGRVLRISAQLYNDLDQYRALAQALGPALGL